MINYPKYLILNFELFLYLMQIPSIWTPQWCPWLTRQAVDSWWTDRDKCWRTCTMPLPWQQVTLAFCQELLSKVVWHNWQIWMLLTKQYELYFFLFDLIVYFICKITSKGHNIKLPGYMITSMFKYRQYEFFFFKIGYTEHHLCFIWNIYTWTCIYIKNFFIINLSFISDICGWTSRMWKERVHQNVWIFWERAW